MAGGRKTREKAQELRKEIQTKAKMTRDELSGSLLKDIRAEQLDAKPGEATFARNRISRLSTLGAAKELAKTERLGLVRMDEIVGQRPPRWDRLLSADITVEEWKAVASDVLDEVVDVPDAVSPDTIYALNEGKVTAIYKSRCYDDEDMLKLIRRAYRDGIEDAAKYATTDDQVISPVARLKKVVAAQRKIVDFLLTDHTERLNPILELTPRELTERIVLYFVECDITKRFYTVPGLAFYLGFPSREEFHEYIGDQNNKDSINLYILKRAMMYIESETVTDMMYGGGLMTGHKINLATNFNYSDSGKSKPAADKDSITINNNIVAMTGIPPKPESIEEWQAWYLREQQAKVAEIKQAPCGQEQDVVDIEAN